MTSYITEAARRTPVVGGYDVVVVGGGVAGVAAAVAAARTGASVCLLEKENGLGGLATLGVVLEYLALCDGVGHQVVGGLGEEFLKLSVRDGSGRIPDCWLPGGEEGERRKHRYAALFNGASFMLALEELALATGVKLFYDTRFCDVAKDGERIEAVIVENKSGRSAILCRTAVDASGDADVCARAGEQTVSYRTNVAAGWLYITDGERISLERLTQHFDMAAGPPPAGDRGFAGDEAADVTDMTVASHEMMKKHVAEKSEAEGRPFYPFLLPSIPCFRMTRRLRGTVEIEDGDDRRWFEDTVGMIGDWQRAGPVYCVPFRALAAERSENLLVAGRCIAVGDTAWNATRVIPGCVVTGEAAGTAAALACREASGRVAELDVGTLQERLREQNVLIDTTFAAR